MRRAVTDQQKEEVLAQILALWKKYPALRLMQLIGNAFPPRFDAYHIEDYELTGILLNCYSRKDEMSED